MQYQINSVCKMKLNYFCMFYRENIMHFSCNTNIGKNTNSDITATNQQQKLVSTTVGFNSNVKTK